MSNFLLFCLFHEEDTESEVPSWVDTGARLEVTAGDKDTRGVREDTGMSSRVNSVSDSGVSRGEGTESNAGSAAVSEGKTSWSNGGASLFSAGVILVGGSTAIVTFGNKKL